MDPSNGYDAVADEFRRRRRAARIGVDTVRRWAKELPTGANVLDLGCGAGVPVTQTLIEEGLVAYGVDASARMIEAFRESFPQAGAACERVEDSDFFRRPFDGVIAWGLLFLLPEENQRRLIQRVADVLVSGGRFLFTAPHVACTWTDVLTERISLSLGMTVYQQIAREAGLAWLGSEWDEGENHYYSFVKA